MRELLWALIIYGWTLCQSVETSPTIRGETDEAGPPIGWWSGRTELHCWIGRRFRPRRSLAERYRQQHTRRTDCRVPRTIVHHLDSLRLGLGGAAVQGVLLAASLSPTQMAAAPHPRPPAPRRAKMKHWFTVRNIARMQDRGRRSWKTGWWNGRKRTRSCRSLWSHSIPEQVGHKICNMELSWPHVSRYQTFISGKIVVFYTQWRWQK